MTNIIICIQDCNSLLRIAPTDVVVISAQKGFFEKRMEITSQLRSAGIRAEFLSHKVDKIQSVRRR